MLARLAIPLTLAALALTAAPAHARDACFGAAVRDLQGDRRSDCVGWKWDVFSWFAMHPEVTTVFVAGLTGGSGVVASPGKTAFQTSQQGYLDAWSNFPDTVKRIVVIRDTPKFL